jgi:hypothetical protein
VRFHVVPVSRSCLGTRGKQGYKEWHLRQVGFVVVIRNVVMEIELIRLDTYGPAINVWLELRQSTVRNLLRLVSCRVAKMNSVERSVQMYLGLLYSSSFLRETVHIKWTVLVRGFSTWAKLDLAIIVRALGCMMFSALTAL